MVKIKKPNSSETPIATLDETGPPSHGPYAKTASAPVAEKPRKSAPVTALPKPKKEVFDPEYVTKLSGKVYTDLCEGVGPQGLKVETAESRGVIYQKIVRSVLRHLKIEGKLINL